MKWVPHKNAEKRRLYQALPQPLHGAKFLLDLETIVSYIRLMSNFSQPQSPEQRHRGRPREFDLERALDGAIKVFSRRGYHATSVGDLTDAMELAQGSLYKAFKDKKAVFIATMERYRIMQTERFEAAVAGFDTGYERLRAGLMFYAERSHGGVGSDGCLVVGAAADLAALDDDIAVVRTPSALTGRLAEVGAIRFGRLWLMIGEHGFKVTQAEPVAVWRLEV